MSPGGGVRVQPIGDAGIEENQRVTRGYVFRDGEKQAAGHEHRDRADRKQ